MIKIIITLAQKCVGPAGKCPVCQITSPALLAEITGSNKNTHAQPELQTVHCVGLRLQGLVKLKEDPHSQVKKKRKQKCKLIHFNFERSLSLKTEWLTNTIRGRGILKPETSQPSDIINDSCKAPASLSFCLYSLVSILFSSFTKPLFKR